MPGCERFTNPGDFGLDTGNAHRLPSVRGRPYQAQAPVGWRSAYVNSAPVHRGAEPASGRCALKPQPKGRGTSLALIGSRLQTEHI
jgi:hypothetical protein